MCENRCEAAELKRPRPLIQLLLLESAVGKECRGRSYLYIKRLVIRLTGNKISMQIQNALTLNTLSGIDLGDDKIFWIQKIGIICNKIENRKQLKSLESKALKDAWYTSAVARFKCSLFSIMNLTNTRGEGFTSLSSGIFKSVRKEPGRVALDPGDVRLQGDHVYTSFAIMYSFSAFALTFGFGSWKCFCKNIWTQIENLNSLIFFGGCLAPISTTALFYTYFRLKWRRLVLKPLQHIYFL